MWGWLLLLTYTLADAVLLFGGRTGPDFGAALGLIPRYAADIVPVLLVALGLVARAATGGPAPRTYAAGHTPLATAEARGPAQWPGAGLPRLSAVTTAVVAPHSFNEDDRAYVRGPACGPAGRPTRRGLRRAGARQRHGLVVRRPRSVSTVVGTAPEDPVFDLPAYAMRMVDPAGRLRLINLVGTVSDVQPRRRLRAPGPPGRHPRGARRAIGHGQAGGPGQLLHLRVRLPRRLDAGR